MHLLTMSFISSMEITLFTLTVIPFTSSAIIGNNLSQVKNDREVIFQNNIKQSSSTRNSRALHEITLNDPLNCLSRVVCGLHKFPPKKPNLRTSTTNDYAFLLRTVLSSQKTSEFWDLIEHNRRISKYNEKNKDDELFDDVNEKEVEREEDVDEATEDDEEYSEEEDEEEDKVGRKTTTRLRSAKSRQGRRYSERSGDPSIIGTVSEKMADDLEELVDYSSKGNGGNKHQSLFEQLKPNVDIDKLELLRVSTDLGTKLSSPPSEQCSVHGNICPFRYDEMIKLMSGILRRQTIVSPSGDKIIPLVGYILKSRNQTTTLTATFSAIERINNLTYTADEAGSPITFRHIHDEILNGMGTGNSGIRVLDDSNEKASASVWEDDEFDQVLNNPYVEKKLVNNYVLKHKNQQPAKPLVEEESSEEADDPFEFVDFDVGTEDEESSEDDTGKKKTKFSDILSKNKNSSPPPPPPAFGTISD